MIVAKTAPGFKVHQFVTPKSCYSEESSSPCPATSVLVGRLSPGGSSNSRATTTKNAKLSFCFAFLLATSTLVSIEVLFHVGFGDNFAPIVCDDGADDVEMETSQQATAVDISRVRFPRTKRRLPQCIIIGVRKSGTRALLEFLNLHPMIQKATEEVHFFDDDSKYTLGLDWYRRKMPYSFPGQITIEKSPAYFITPTVPERILEMDPAIKLLLIVRDPVIRLISDYAQLASNKVRKDRKISAFEELVLLPDGRVNVAYKAVRISMYSMFFKKWLRTFGRGKIHIVDGDKLVANPYSEIQKIEDYLGIGHKVQKNNFFYNQTKGFYCVRNATAEKCLNESKGRRHPAVSPKVVSVLRKFYEPYNEHFYRQTGINFSWPLN